MRNVAMWLGTVVLVLVLVAYGLDLISYIRTPENYRFGTEVSGLLYRSRTNFLLSGTAMILVCGFGLLAPYFMRNKDHAFWTRIGTAAVVVVAAGLVALTARLR